MKLKNRHAVLTGGSGGIGLELARGLLEEGAKVTILDIAPPRESIGGTEDVHVELCDLQIGADIARALASAAEKMGTIDILIHAAAHQPAYPFEEMPFDGWRTTFAVNVDAFYHLVQGVLPGMKEKGWGRILAFASTTFDEGTPEHADYVGSKAALIGVARVLAKEIGKFGINVNTLSPGLTKTNMSAHHVEEMVKMGHPNYFDMYVERQSLKRTLVPRDHVGPVIFLVSDDSEAVSGQTLIVDGGKQHG